MRFGVKLRFSIRAESGAPLYGQSGKGRYNKCSNTIQYNTHTSYIHIQHRVQFKILSLMHNCLVGVTPSYLRSFCTFVSSLPARTSLRSSTRGLMVVPRTLGALPVMAHQLGTLLPSLFALSY